MSRCIAIISFIAFALFCSEDKQCFAQDSSHIREKKSLLRTGADITTVASSKGRISHTGYDELRNLDNNKNPCTLIKNGMAVQIQFQDMSNNVDWETEEMDLSSQNVGDSKATLSKILEKVKHDEHKAVKKRGFFRLRKWRRSGSSSDESSDSESSDNESSNESWGSNGSLSNDSPQFDGHLCDEYLNEHQSDEDHSAIAQENVEDEQVETEREHVEGEQLEKEQEQSEAEEIETEQEQAEAEEIETEQEQAEAEQVEAEQEQAEAEKVETEQEKSEAEQVETEQEQAEAEQVETEQEQAEAEQVESEQEQAEAEQVETEQEQAEAEQVESEQEQAETGQVENDQEQSESDQFESEQENVESESAETLQEHVESEQDQVETEKEQVVSAQEQVESAQEDSEQGKVENEQEDVEQVDTEQEDADKIESEQLNVEQVETEQEGSEHVETEQVGVEQVKTAQEVTEKGESEQEDVEMKDTLQTEEKKPEANQQETEPETMHDEESCGRAFVFCSRISTCFMDRKNFNNGTVPVKKNDKENPWGLSMNYDAEINGVIDCDIYMGVTSGCNFPTGAKVGKARMYANLFHFSLDPDLYESNSFQLYAGRCDASFGGNSGASQVDDGTECNTTDVALYARDVQRFPLIHNGGPMVSSFVFNTNSPINSPLWSPKYSVFPLGREGFKKVVAHAYVCPKGMKMPQHDVQVDDPKTSLKNVSEYTLELTPSLSSLSAEMMSSSITNESAQKPIDESNDTTTYDNCESGFVYCPGRTRCLTDITGDDNSIGWSIKYESTPSSVLECRIYTGLEDKCSVSKAKVVGTFTIFEDMVNFSLKSGSYVSNAFHFYVGECPANDNGHHVYQEHECSQTEMSLYATDYSTYPMYKTLDSGYLDSYTFDSNEISKGSWTSSYMPFPLGHKEKTYISAHVSVCTV